MQAELFSNLPITSWLPDEILYSLVSRYHQLSGNASAKTTCQRLFGHPQGGFSFDFPSRLNDFVSLTGETLGDANSIIHRRTILSAYLPFWSCVDAAAAIQAVCGAGIGSMRQTLGLTRSTARGYRRLRACQSCMEEDKGVWATTYWHRSHQLPGVLICLKHGDVLYESTFESIGPARFQWTLPSNNFLRPALMMHSPVLRGEVALKAAGVTLLRRLANNIEAVARLPLDFHFDENGLTNTYGSTLGKMGFSIERGGKRNVAAIRRCFGGFLSPLLDTNKFKALYSSSGRGGSRFGRQYVGADPVHQMLLVTWLFESWEDFISCYQLMNRAPRSERIFS